MAREYSIGQTLPGIEAPLVLPELLDPDELLPGSLAEAGFRYKGVQGEVFGRIATSRRDDGVEIVVHGEGGSWIFVDADTVYKYRSMAQGVNSDEPLQRIIIDTLSGKIGEPSNG